MEVLAENLKSKSTFHEIKNQISVCDLYLEIIKKTLAKENIKNDTLERAIKTINNSLKAIGSSMHELKAQVNPVNIQTFKFSPLVNDVFFACVSYSNGKDIEFKNLIDADFEISADKDKMYSVLINLCKNAVEAISQEGYVKIYNEANSIYIENNGEPILQAIQQSVFDDGFTTKSDGSGLGLMIVKKFLNAQNFDIELISSSIDGTLFKINM